MMDILTRVVTPGSDLLERVDRALLAGGAPPDHPIWPLLRRLGALPGELVAGLAAADPEALRLAARQLSELAESYVDGTAAVPADPGWRGDAAAAFGVRWQAMAGYLSEGTESMAGRLAATASYVDDVAGWLAGTRDAVALALAECLDSIEATTLRTLPAGALASGAPGLASAWLAAGDGAAAGAGRDRGLRAAATLGAHVLAAASRALEEGEALRVRWSGHLGELAYRPAAAPVPRGGSQVALPD